MPKTHTPQKADRLYLRWICSLSGYSSDALASYNDMRGHFWEGLKIRESPPCKGALTKRPLERHLAPPHIRAVQRSFHGGCGCRVSG